MADDKNVDLTKIGFGVLNAVDQSIGGLSERMDAGVDFMDAVFNSATRQFTTNALANTGPYKAIVLRVEKSPEKAEAGSWLSNTIGSFFGDVGTIVKIKARIPEIHAALPVPQELGSADGPHQQIIDLYPTFTAQDTEIEEPKPGDIVNVDFGNKNTYSDPIYLGPLIKTAGQGGSQGVAGSNIFGDCTGQNNLGVAAPVGEALPGENESKPSLGLIPLAPRIQQNLESPNETIIGQIGALINVKNDWEKALKTQAEQTASDFPGFGLLPPNESINEIFEVKGRTWIGNIPTNGFDDPGKLLGKDRDTIIFVPYSTDLATSTTSEPAPNPLNRVEIIFLFHDLGGFTYEMFLAVAQTLGQMGERNYVLVMPEMPWSVYTNYASIEGNRIDEPFEYELFFDEVVAKIDEVFGTTLVESGKGYMYPTVVAVGASAQAISNARNNDNFRCLGYNQGLKNVFAISPSLQEQQSQELVYHLGTPVPLLSSTSTKEEEKMINKVLEEINSVISGENEPPYINWDTIPTYTFLGYDGVYSTNLDHIVTSVSNYLIGPDRTTNLVYFDGVKENIDSNAYTARALLSSKEFDANPLKNALPDKSPITDPPIADGSGTLPDGLTKEESTAFFESILPQFAEPIVQDCIMPLGGINESASGAQGSFSSPNFPTKVIPGQEGVPFNGGKNGVIVINGVEYSYPEMKAHKKYKKTYERPVPPTKFVLHISAGTSTSADSLYNTLNNKSCGVHFCITPAGEIVQNADPITEWVSHGPPHNKTSIGIEIMNPFYGKNVTDKHKSLGWQKLYPVPFWWMIGNKDSGYTLPSELQVSAVKKLIATLNAKIPSLQNAFPSKDFNKGGPKRFQWTKKAEKVDKEGKKYYIPLAETTVPPGTISHRDYNYNREDGRYYLLRYLEAVTGQMYLPSGWSDGIDLQVGIGDEALTGMLVSEEPDNNFYTSEDPYYYDMTQSSEEPIPEGPISEKPYEQSQTTYASPEEAQAADGVLDLLPF